MTYRALITGISGSGGSYLAEHIIKTRDWDVCGFSRWRSGNKGHAPREAKLREVDLNDVSSILRGLLWAQPHYIFHLASHANVRASFDVPLAVLQNNIMGTANLLEAMRLWGSTATLLMCSSSEVYGQVREEETPIRETQALRPASPYAVSKVTQDLLARTYWLNYKLPVIRTRMFSYFNPRRADLFSTSFARQIVAIERGEQAELLHGNLDSVRTMLDVRDAMEAYCAAIEKCTPGEVYNIGGESTCTVGQILDYLCKRSTARIPYRADTALLRPTDVTLQIPDAEKFIVSTGWGANYTLEQSIDHLLAHCRAS